MTLWYEPPGNPKDAWHWMGACLSQAHTIGLHREQVKSDMDQQRKQLRKRLWWCIYARDRLIALGMRRPALVHDDSYNIPMLTIDDFQFGSPELLRTVGCGLMPQRVDKQRFSALLFIEMVKLSLCISKVLSVQYCVASTRFGDSAATATMLTPRKTVFEIDKFEQCDAMLKDWVTRLPTELRIERLRSKSSAFDVGSSLHIHGAVLRMVYLATIGALYRPPALFFPDLNAELRDASRRRIRQAAHETTTIASDLHQLNLTRYLPTVGVTTLLSAGATHLLEIRSKDLEVSLVGLRGFEQCMQILHRLQEIHTSADFATNLLKYAAIQTGVQVTEDEIDAPGRSTCFPALNPVQEVCRQPEILDEALNPEEFNMNFHNFVNLFNDTDGTKNEFDSLLNLEDAGDDAPFHGKPLGKENKRVF